MTPAAPKPPAKKKRDPRREWAAERAAWLAQHPTCQGREYGLLHECGGSIQAHHVQPRMMGGSRRRDLLKATLCETAHAHVESNRDEARDLGLLVRRGTP